MVSNQIYQHLANEQKKFAKQLLNHLSRLQGASYFIDLGFLDLSEQELVINLANQKQVDYKIEKLYPEQERCRTYIGDSTYSEESIIVEASYNAKFNQIEHRHVLGTLINEADDYTQFGDIIINATSFQLICSSKGLEELQMGFSTINKAKLKYDVVNEVDYQIPELKQTTYIVTSLRLDNVVKAIMGVARTGAQKHIRNKMVNVNYVENSNVNHELKLNDLISVRKYGRKKIVAIEATRTGKYRIVVQ